jgi:hypothetical protein
MHEFRVVRQEFPETVDATGAPVLAAWYTFHVSEDGTTWFPSLKWFRECNVAGLPKTYYVDRCVGRVKAGRSAEAFGQSAVVLADGKPVGFAAVEKGRGRGAVYAETGPAKVAMVTGRGGLAKPREERKGFKAKVDGAELPRTYPTEAAAKAACAIHCFMTRHKLGRVAHVLERLKEEFPDAKEHKAWACCQENAIRATVDGVEYAIGWLPDVRPWTVEKFKPLSPTE